MSTSDQEIETIKSSIAHLNFLYGKRNIIESIKLFDLFDSINPTPSNIFFKCYNKRKEEIEVAIDKAVSYIRLVIDSTKTQKLYIFSGCYYNTLSIEDEISRRLNNKKHCCDEINFWIRKNYKYYKVRPERYLLNDIIRLYHSIKKEI